MSIDEIEQTLDRLDSEIAWELYLTKSGQGTGSIKAAIYSQYQALFTLDNVERVRTALAAVGGSNKQEKARLARIALSLTSYFVEAEVAPLSDELERRKQALVIETPAGPTPYLRTSEQTCAIADPALRRAVWQAHCDAILSELAPVGLKVWQARQRVAQGLGYRTYSTMFARLRGIDLRQLAHDTEVVLAATEAPHRAALARALQRYAGVGLAEANAADFRYALRQLSIETHLGSLDAMGAVRATVAGMGIDLDHLPGLEYNLEDRPGKVERAAIFTIDPPRRQIINCRPNRNGGLESLRTLLHETGHGLHFSHTDPALPSAIRRNSDARVGEAMAFLLDSLIREPLWLQEVLGLDAGRTHDIVFMQRLCNRYLARQMAGMCQYQLVFDRGTSERAAAQYQKTLSEAVGVCLHGSGYALNVDPELYAVGYFYADVLTAQILQSLRTAYGVRWWTSPACGQRLQQVWRNCSACSPTDLVRQFGHRYVTPAPLLRQLVADEPVDAATMAG